MPCLRRSIDPRRGAGRYGLTVSGAISNLTNSQSESQTSLSHTFVRHCEQSRFLYPICDFYSSHWDRGSSQSVSIYRWEIEAKISISVSISRFLRIRLLLYLGVLPYRGGWRWRRALICERREVPRKPHKSPNCK